MAHPERSRPRRRGARSDADPARTRFETDVIYRWHEHAFRADIRAQGTIASDVEAFEIDLRLEVDLDDDRFFGRRWSERIPRRLV